jgi:hypothetical protein
MKHEWKKHEKALYLPRAKPEVVDVPALNFFCIDGQGSPASEDFSARIEALYATSYTVRMSHKSDLKPDGYFEYTVYPLEGVWDLIDPTKGPLDKTNFKYTIMIRQPDFLTEAQANNFLQVALTKKKKPIIGEVYFKTIEEGRCIQMLHNGPFEDEPASFELMEAFCAEQGLTRKSKVHREIYLSDNRKVAPEKLKTTLRFKTVSS